MATPARHPLKCIGEHLGSVMTHAHNQKKEEII